MSEITILPAAVCPFRHVIAIGSDAIAATRDTCPTCTQLAGTLAGADLRDLIFGGSK